MLLSPSMVNDPIHPLFPVLHLTNFMNITPYPIPNTLHRFIMNQTLNHTHIRLNNFTIHSYCFPFPLFDFLQQNCYSSLNLQLRFFRLLKCSKNPHV